MKQRITYVVEDPEAFAPDHLLIQDDQAKGPTFSLKNVQAAKEHRVTLGLDELPRELSLLFRQWHEIHIRWASPVASAAQPPFTSRVSSGLHVFFTPLANTEGDELCHQIHKYINADLRCGSMADASIKIPTLSERFSMSASSQYYAYLESIVDSMVSFQARFCKSEHGVCRILGQQLSTAAYVDVDYDTITRAVVLTAVWSKAPNQSGWSDVIELPTPDSTVEIGVLSHEPNSDPEDVQFGGFLTVLGQDTAPKATRFQTPTRHYPLLRSSESSTATPQLLPLTFAAGFSQPTGLHPTLVLSFPRQHLVAPNPSCKLHAHLTLPSYLFIDKYQFNDALFLKAKNLKSLRSLAGAKDLEAPDWVINQWGSAALFELSHPRDLEQTIKAPLWNVSIPLHLRYLPATNTSHTRMPVAWPVVFWACRSDEGAKMASNPFDRVHLGYETLFGPKTRFMHVNAIPKGNGTGQLVHWINVPILNTQQSGWVEIGTVGTVVMAFLGLCWVLLGRNRQPLTQHKKHE